MQNTIQALTISYWKKSNYSCLSVFHSRIDGSHKRTVVAAIEAEVGDTCDPTTGQCRSVWSLGISHYTHNIIVITCVHNHCIRIG